MRSFSIRALMVGAIGVVLVLVLLLGVGGAGLWGMQRLQPISHDFVSHAFEEAKALSRLRLALADVLRYENDMVIHYESDEQIAVALLKWTQSRQLVREQITRMQNGQVDEDNSVLESLEKHLAAYAAAA